jgi:hypothetical protein
MQPLYVGHRAVQLPLLFIAFGGAWSIRLTQLVILLGVSVVEGRLLEEHDEGLVFDLWDNIPLIVETLNEFSEGLSLLLYDAFEVLVNSWWFASSPKVVVELPAQVRP